MVIYIRPGVSVSVALLYDLMRCSSMDFLGLSFDDLPLDTIS